jgi:hypothetical protein
MYFEFFVPNMLSEHGKYSGGFGGQYKQRQSKETRAYPYRSPEKAEPLQLQ